MSRVTRQRTPGRRGTRGQVQMVVTCETPLRSSCAVASSETQTSEDGPAGSKGHPAARLAAGLTPSPAPARGGPARGVNLREASVPRLPRAAGHFPSLRRRDDTLTLPDGRLRLAHRSA